MDTFVKQFLLLIGKMVLTNGQQCFSINGMDEDLYVTVQQVASWAKITRQGVHHNIRRGFYGEPYRGAVPPGKVMIDLDNPKGRPPTIWLKFDEVVAHYCATYLRLVENMPAEWANN